jgi:8-oxo-dGTP pyrophosphatase MutT (NUDIX family)
MDPNQLTVEEIRVRLAANRRGPVINRFPPGYLDGESHPAAVLIPFLRKGNAWHLLFIRRTERPHDRHSGQVAFPGGGSELQDKDIVAAALREAQEEINLSPADVNVLGRLNDFVTISNYSVTPVVGVIPWPYEFTLESSEVSRVFSIPLVWLADIGNRRTVMRNLPQLGDVPVTYFNEYDGEILWGASASFTLELLRTIL